MVERQPRGTLYKKKVKNKIIETINQDVTDRLNFEKVAIDRKQIDR